MGLFIGASILTMLEIFDYLYEVTKCFTYLKKFQTKKDLNPAAFTLKHRIKLNGSIAKNLFTTSNVFFTF